MKANTSAAVVAMVVQESMAATYFKIRSVDPMQMSKWDGVSTEGASCLTATPRELVPWPASTTTLEACAQTDNQLWYFEGKVLRNKGNDLCLERGGGDIYHPSEFPFGAECHRKYTSVKQDFHYNTRTRRFVEEETGDCLALNPVGSSAASSQWKRTSAVRLVNCEGDARSYFEMAPAETIPIQYFKIKSTDPVAKTKWDGVATEGASCLTASPREMVPWPSSTTTLEICDDQSERQFWYFNGTVLQNKGNKLCLERGGGNIYHPSEFPYGQECHRSYTSVSQDFTYDAEHARFVEVETGDCLALNPAGNSAVSSVWKESAVRLVNCAAGKDSKAYFEMEASTVASGVLV